MKLLLGYLDWKKHNVIYEEEQEKNNVNKNHTVRIFLCPVTYTKSNRQ